MSRELAWHSAGVGFLFALDFVHVCAQVCKDMSTPLGSVVNLSGCLIGRGGEGRGSTYSSDGLPLYSMHNYGPAIWLSGIIDSTCRVDVLLLYYLCWHHPT